MRGRRHVGEVELGDLRDRVEDRVELLPEALDLVLAQLEARELRDVQHLLSVDLAMRFDPSKNGEGPFRGPLTNAWFRQVL